MRLSGQRMFPENVQIALRWLRLQLHAHKPWTLRIPKLVVVHADYIRSLITVSQTHVGDDAWARGSKPTSAFHRLILYMYQNPHSKLPLLVASISLMLRASFQLTYGFPGGSAEWHSVRISTLEHVSAVYVLMLCSMVHLFMDHCKCVYTINHNQQGCSPQLFCFELLVWCVLEFPFSVTQTCMMCSTSVHCPS